MIFLGQMSFFHRYVIRAGDSIWFIFYNTLRQEPHNFELLNCIHLQTRELSMETMSVREIEILESILKPRFRDRERGPWE